MTSVEEHARVVASLLTPIRTTLTVGLDDALGMMTAHAVR
jgi:molybdopterin biosynthesis enzyme